MSDLNALARSVNSVFLNNVIEGCVINIGKNSALIKAIDSSASVFVHTKAPLEEQDPCVIGIHDLRVFNKYINSVKGIDATLNIKDNRLKIKTARGSSVQYLLAEPDLVPSYNDEWPDSILEDELANFGKGVKLQKADIDEFLQLISVFNSNSVEFVVSKKGAVSVQGGNETQHQISVPLGKIKGVGASTVKVYTEFLVSIFNAMNFDEEPTLYIREQEQGEIVPIIVGTTSTHWVIQPIE